MSGHGTASAKPSGPSLSDILAASILAEDHTALAATAAQPTLGEILGEALRGGGIEPEREHPARSRISDYRLDDDYSLQVVALAREFCAEMEAQSGMLAEDVWEELAAEPALHDNLATIQGWATLSAFVSGGTFVLRLPMTQVDR